MPRLVWYSVAMSLDGFIAGPKGEYNWIPNEPEIDWAGFMGRFDTVLMGRQSYAASLTALGVAGEMPGMKSYVFSRTLDQAKHPKVTVVRENQISETLSALRKAEGKQIWLFGGGDLFRSLMAKGEVDRIEVGLTPVLLGGGIPFLPGLDKLAQLRLLETRHYAASGIMMLTYEVRRG